MEARIKQLVENTPNDIELGAAVRALYWADRNMNEVIDPNQLSLFSEDEMNSMINESNN